jgi:hypothetical protein
MCSMVFLISFMLDEMTYLEDSWIVRFIYDFVFWDLLSRRKRSMQLVNENGMEDIFEY